MTEQTAIETTVLSVLCDVLSEPVESFRTTPVLAAHEWDSLSSLEVLAQLESRVGVNLDLRSYHAARTVVDLVDLVARTAAAGAAARR